MRPNIPSVIDISCANSDCGRPMTVRTAGTGVFLGCSGYALPPKERCKATINLTPGDEAVNIDEDDEAESKRLLQRKRCDQCNTRRWTAILLTTPVSCIFAAIIPTAAVSR